MLRNNDLLYSRWLHKKSHHVYIVVGGCILEASCEAALLYVREDDRQGVPWARSREQFLDGRFERLTELPVVRSKMKTPHQAGS